MATLIRRLLAMIRRGRLDRELKDELARHLELKTDALVADGLSPDEARRRAAIAVGNVTRLREESRALWGFPSIDALLLDTRYGLRQLRRAPAFAAAAVLTLGLAIGANSALFAIAHAVLLRPLPYPEPGRIVSITVASKGTDIQRMDEPTAQLALTAGVDAFEALATYQSAGANLNGGDQPERVSGARVSGRFFAAIGVQPALGRTFVTEEFQTGGPSAVILSDSLWTRAFARRPDVINRTLSLDDQTYLVIGVMPGGFRFPFRSEFWLPSQPRKIGSGFYYTDFIGRLRAGVSVSAARDALTSLRRSHERDLPEGARELELRLMPLHERLYGSYRGSLVLLLGVVGCVLLIACANVANLLLARASVRRRELALRAALGANRTRLIRQLLVESVLLAGFGAIPGLALAEIGLRAFLAVGPRALARIPGIALDGTVLAFTVAITVGTGLLFGIAPALAAGRADPHEWLKGTRSGRATAGRSHPRRILVVLQLGTAVVLTIGAALLAKSFVRFQAIDRGFDADNVLTASVTLPRTRYADEATRASFYDRVLERLRALPAVESASIAPVAVTGMTLTMTWPRGLRSDPSDTSVLAVLTNVSPQHFRTFGMPILEGTECGAVRDIPTAVINRQAARRAFGDRSAVGERLDLAAQGTYTIVGVAADVRAMGTKAPPLSTVYTCASPTEGPFSSVIAVRARTGHDPATLAPAIRESVRAVDPAQPVSAVMTVAQQVGEAVTSRWFDALLIACFAALSLVLAIFGLYALIAYLVAQRIHEIGVRMALGADARHVRRLVLRQASTLTALGIGLGSIAAVPLVRFIRTLLFEVEPLDAGVFAAMAAVLAIVAIAAAAIPARRASRLDPLIALRAE
jgi:putative ABC transport system permease protein